MTFQPFYEESEADLFAQRQRQQELANVPYQQSLQADDSYRNFFVNNRAGQDLAAFATALNPQGPLAKAAISAEQSRRINILADEEDKADERNRNQIEILTAKDLDSDQYKETRNAAKESLKLARELREKGGSAEAAEAVQNATGFRRVVIASKQLQGHIPGMEAFIADALNKDNRWIKIGDSEMQINSEKLPSQQSAVVALLKHEYMLNNGLYGYTREIRNRSGFTKGVKDTINKSLTAHRKNYEFEQGQRGIELAWNLADESLAVGEKPSLRPIFDAYGATKNEKGEFLSNSEVIEEVFDHLSNLAEVSPKEADKHVAWLEGATYEIGGGQTVTLSKVKIGELKEKIASEAAKQEQQDEEMRRAARNIEASDFRSKMSGVVGNIDEQAKIITKSQQWWDKQSFSNGTEAPWIRKWRLNQKVDPKDQRTNMLRLIADGNVIPQDMWDNLHDENLEWGLNKKKEYDLNIGGLNSPEYKDRKGSIQKLIHASLKLTSPGYELDFQGDQLLRKAEAFYKKEFLKNVKELGNKGAADFALQEVKAQHGDYDKAGWTIETGSLFGQQVEDSKKEYARIKRGDVGASRLLSAITNLGNSIVRTVKGSGLKDVPPEVIEKFRPYHADIIDAEKGLKEFPMSKQFYREVYSKQNPGKSYNHMLRELDEGLGGKPEVSAKQKELDENLVKLCSPGSKEYDAIIARNFKNWLNTGQIESVNRLRICQKEREVNINASNQQGVLLPSIQ